MRNTSPEKKMKNYQIAAAAFASVIMMSLPELPAVAAAQSSVELW